MKIESSRNRHWVGNSLLALLKRKGSRFDKRGASSYSSREINRVRERMATVTGYCVKCKAKDREMTNPEQVTLKNGKPAVKGVCAVCGTKMFKIGSTL